MVSGVLDDNTLSVDSTTVVIARSVIVRVRGAQRALYRGLTPAHHRGCITALLTRAPEYMDDLRRLRTINPSPEEVEAACAAFGELPPMDELARLIMVRRAVAAGFYTDDLQPHNSETSGGEADQTIPSGK